MPGVRYREIGLKWAMVGNCFMKYDQRQQAVNLLKNKIKICTASDTSTGSVQCTMRSKIKKKWEENEWAKTKLSEAKSRTVGRETKNQDCLFLTVSPPGIVLRPVRFLLR